MDHVRRASSYPEYDASVTSCYATRRDNTIGGVCGDNEAGERPWHARRIGRVALDRAHRSGCRSHRDKDPRSRLRPNCAAEGAGEAQSEPDAATPKRRLHEHTVNDQYYENVIGDRLPQIWLRLLGPAGQHLCLSSPHTFLLRMPSWGVARLRLAVGPRPLQDMTAVLAEDHNPSGVSRAGQPSTGAVGYPGVGKPDGGQRGHLSPG